MQIKHSHTKLSNNGGIIKVLDVFAQKGVPQLIDACLGQRPAHSKYAFSDIFKAWLVTQFTYGYRLLRVEDTKQDLSIVPGLKLPSHDSVAYAMKQLAAPYFNLSEINPKNKADGQKQYTVSENELLNDLLIKTSLQLGAIKQGVPYMLDIDATDIQSDVKDATFTYNHHRGFVPMVCMIGKQVVYVSMRGGNCNPHYKKLECLKLCIELLEKNGVVISDVRIDAAGYKKDVLEYLHSKNIHFCVSASFNERTKKVAAYARWTDTTFSTAISDLPAQTCSRQYRMQNSKHNFRMVCIRMKKEEAVEMPAYWKTIKKHRYRFIITNNNTVSEIDIVNQYKQRGTFEQNFAALKHDFGWRILPFSKLDQNGVYLLFTAFANNVYQFMVSYFAKHVKAIKPNIKLHTFRKLFIQVVFTIKKSTCIFFGPTKIDFSKM